MLALRLFIRLSQHGFQKNRLGLLPADFEDWKILYSIGYTSRAKVENVLVVRYEIVFKMDEGEALGFKVKGRKLA
jgi:hypothetical protein